MGALGLIAAWLALISQLVLGTLVLPDAAPKGGLDRMAGLSVICRPGHPPPDHHPQPHLPGPEQALLALAAAVALPGIILTSATVLPKPGLVSCAPSSSWRRTGGSSVVSTSAASAGRPAHRHRCRGA